MNKTRTVTLLVTLCLIVTMVPFWGCYYATADPVTPVEGVEVMKIADRADAGQNLLTSLGRMGNVETVEIPDHDGKTKMLYRMDTLVGGSSGLTQTINSPKLGTYVLSGWSRGENVVRSITNEYYSYSLVAMISYADGTNKDYSTIFSYGTHDWEYREVSFTISKPAVSMLIYIFLRDPASGTAFFDELSLTCADDNSGLATFQDLPMEMSERPESQPTKTLLRTDDGLEMGLGETQVTELRIDGQDVFNDALSGFLVRDVAAKDNTGVYSFEPGKGSSPEAFTGTQPTLGLGLTADYSAVANHIAVSGVITDTTKSEDGRAIQLSYALPVGGSGWKWGTSVLDSETVACGKTSNVYKTVGDGYLSVVDWDSEPNTYYPMAAFYNEELGIAVATAMDFPCYWELEYNGSIGSYVITYQLGITDEAPDAARFKFVIYKLDDPAWGFRASAKKYSQVFPEYYETLEKEHGLWLAWANIDAVENVEDFGIKFKEVDGMSRAQGYYEMDHGIKGYYYIENGDWWLANLRVSNADGIWEKINELASEELGDTTVDANRPKYQALATQFCKVLDYYGEIAWNPVNNDWCPNGSQVHVNANPALPGAYNFYSLWINEERLAKLFDPIVATGAVFDGIYLDELSGWWLGNANFNKEHYKYTSVPLTYSPYYRSPMLHRASTTWEFVKKLADELHAEGRTIFANKSPDKHAFYVPLVDAMGTEQTSMNGTVYSPQTIQQLSTWRTLSYSKPFCILLSNDYNAMTHDLMDRYFARCLAYAIFPSPCMNYSDGTYYFRGPGMFYERDRDIYQKYIPAMKVCSEAGWEPITLASSEDSSLIIERYGDNDAEGIYYVIYNNSTLEKNIEVQLDLSRFELSDACTYTEMLSGVKVDLSDGLYTTYLGADESVCIRIIDPNKQVADDKPDNSGSTTVPGVTNTNKPGSQNSGWSNSQTGSSQSVGATNRLTQITTGAATLRTVYHHLTNGMDEFMNKETYPWTLLLIVVNVLILLMGTLLFLLYRKKRRLRAAANTAVPAQPPTPPTPEDTGE